MCRRLRVPHLGDGVPVLDAGGAWEGGRDALQLYTAVLLRGHLQGGQVRAGLDSVQCGAVWCGAVRFGWWGGQVA